MALSPAVVALLEALPTIEKIRYAELSSSVIVFFDHLITLDQEVNLVWRTHWSLGKILFLLNRYYALCIVIFNNYALFNTDSLSDAFCLAWFRSQGWTGVLAFIITELILLLRLYALYFRDKRVLVFMAIVFLASAAASAYVMGVAMNGVGAMAVTLPQSQSTVCVPTQLPAHFYAFWIPMLISESILCGLALLRGFKAYIPGSNMFQNGKRIIQVLVRDSLFYFVIIFATYLINTILFFARPDSEIEIPIGFAFSLSVVLANRLCLNVRGYIRDDQSILSSLPPPPPGGVALVSLPRSHGHSGYARGWHGRGRGRGPHYPARDDRDGDGYESAEERERAFGQATFSIVHGGPLSDMELRELRVMRAQSPKRMT